MGGISLQEQQQQQCDDGDLGSTAVARTDLLEHENANMRQLLASLHQILGEMRRSAHAQLHGPNDQGDAGAANGPAGGLHEQISSLPITWIYDRIKEEIELSLATISDFLRAAAA